MMPSLHPGRTVMFLVFVCCPSLKCFVYPSWGWIQRLKTEFSVWFSHPVFLCLCVYMSPILIATQQIVVNVLSYWAREAAVCSLYWICRSDNVIWPNRYHPQRPLGAGEDPLVSRFRLLQSVYFCITASPVRFFLFVNRRWKATCTEIILELEWTCWKANYHPGYSCLSKAQAQICFLFNTVSPPTPLSTQILITVFSLRRLGRSWSSRRGLLSAGTTASGRSWGRRRSSWRSLEKKG